MRCVVPSPVSEREEGHKTSQHPSPVEHEEEREIQKFPEGFRLKVDAENRVIGRHSENQKEQGPWVEHGEMRDNECAE